MEKHHYRYEEKGNGYVWADTDMLKQSARILIDNAAKYTPQGEDIVIRVGLLTDDKVTNAPFYEIQDNGIGMAQKDGGALPLTDSTVQMRYATVRLEERGLDCLLPGGLLRNTMVMPRL